MQSFTQMDFQDSICVSFKRAAVIKVCSIALESATSDVQGCCYFPEQNMNGNRICKL